jgi:hypothetical protein
MSVAKVRRMVAVLISLAALMLAFAVPATAHTGHQSCANFAAFQVAYVQGGYQDFGFTNPGFRPFVEQGPPGHEGPGALAAWIALEHELFCD